MREVLHLSATVPTPSAVVQMASAKLDERFQVLKRSEMKAHLSVQGQKVMQNSPKLHLRTRRREKLKRQERLQSERLAWLRPTAPGVQVLAARVAALATETGEIEEATSETAPGQVANWLRAPCPSAAPTTCEITKDPAPSDSAKQTEEEGAHDPHPAALATNGATKATAPTHSKAGHAASVDAAMVGAPHPAMAKAGIIATSLRHP